MKNSEPAKPKGRPATWGDYVPRGDVPANSFVILDGNHGEMRASLAENCPACGGEGQDPGKDPVGVYEAYVDQRGNTRADELVVVCGLCGRTYYDSTGAIQWATKPLDGVDRSREVDAYEQARRREARDGEGV